MGLKESFDKREKTECLHCHILIMAAEDPAVRRRVGWCGVDLGSADRLEESATDVATTERGLRAKKFAVPPPAPASASAAPPVQPLE
jgi:hypothetical protein